VRRLALAVLAAVVVVCPAAAQEGLGASTLVAFRGTVLGVAQDAHSIAWLQASPDGCRFRIRARSAKTIRSIKYASTCNPFDHELLLAGGKAAWGGNDEVLCGETYAAVYAVAGKRVRLVQKIPEDCLGFGSSLRGLVSDGRFFYYNVLRTVRPPSAWQCGEGGVCRWQLVGGRIVRIDGSRPVALRGLPPTVMFAVQAGRIALVEPLRKVSSNGSGAGGWPRAARNGKVEIRSLATGRVEASFRPEGIVRAVALTPSRALVLVEYLGSRTLESYDIRTGRLVKSIHVPQGMRRLAVDGNRVAFAFHSRVRVLDLSTGRDRVVAEAAVNPVGLSFKRGLVVWGENRNKFARIVAARAGQG
jgi:hypothetical protein